MTVATPKQLEYLDDLLAFQMTRARSDSGQPEFDAAYQQFVMRIRIPKNLTKEQASVLINEFKSLTLVDLFQFYRELTAGKYTVDEREARERNAYEDSDYWKPGMLALNSDQTVFKMLFDNLAPEPPSEQKRKEAEEYWKQQEEMTEAESDIRQATVDALLEYNDYRRITALKTRRETYRDFLLCARFEKAAQEGDAQSVEHLKSPAFAFARFYENE